jgi:uncharacterized OB-fold protein
MPQPPEPNEFTAPFWDAVRAGRLVVPECGPCGRRFFVPEVLCPHCGAREWSWQPSPGEGRIYSLSLVHQAVDPAQPTPFVLAAVDLDDGWTMLTQVVDTDPARVAIGDRVAFAPTPVNDEFSLPTFARTGP